MVIREQNEYRLLVTQPAHAWISGQLAENWGGYGFPRPGPWKELCFAAARHDDGWASRDRHPGLNPDTGAPYDFKNIPISDHMIIWDRSVALAGQSSRFAALLVSRHIKGLFSMHDFTREPEDVRQKAGQFEKRQFALQERLAAALKKDDFYRDFIEYRILDWHRRLLSAFDYLSLFLIIGASQETGLSDVPSSENGPDENSPHQSSPAEKSPAEHTPYEKSPEEIGPDANSSTTIRVSKIGEDAGSHAHPNRYAVSPWPFVNDRVELRCDAIRLEKRCADQQELDRALAQSERVLFSVELVPGNGSGSAGPGERVLRNLSGRNDN